MTKVLRCRDVGLECDFVARAETEAGILEKVVEHVQTAHGVKEIPEELAEKVRVAIRDE